VNHEETKITKELAQSLDSSCGSGRRGETHEPRQLARAARSPL